jgi:tetratricopeptide (TPR) repeat protein
VTSIRQFYIAVGVALSIAIPCAFSTNQSSADHQNLKDGIKEQIATGDAFLDKDRCDEAIRNYVVVLQLDPKNFIAHERLGKAYAAKGDIANAISEDVAALRIQPRNASVHQRLGWLCGLSGKYLQAIDEANKALNIDSTNQRAYALLGSALAETLHYQPAVAALEKAIALDPSDFESYEALAATMGRKGDYAGSISVFRKAIALRPNSIHAHLGLGAAYGKIGNINGELAELKQAVRLSPANPITHGHLGSALLRAGNIQGAIKEGAIANELRAQNYAKKAVGHFAVGWGFVFLLFGALFAVTFAGSKFEPQEGEETIKSFFLTFYKDRPGRFVLTTRRIVFVPEVFSRLLRSTRMSIELDLIKKVESSSTAAGGSLTIETVDGSVLVFKMPNLVLRPLLKSLGKADVADRNSSAGIDVSAG